MGCLVSRGFLFVCPANFGQDRSWEAISWTAGWSSFVVTVARRASWLPSVRISALTCQSATCRATPFVLLSTIGNTIKTVCVKTGIGDEPPPGACLFTFPTRERYGLIWAFNGETPAFDLPDFPYPDEELELKIEAFDKLRPVDPWVICCNTPDLQHMKALHGVTLDQKDPDKDIEWTDHSMLYDFKGRHANGEAIEYQVGIVGTSIFYQSSVFDGRWFGCMAPFGLPNPGQTKTYMLIVVRKSDGDAKSNEAFLDFAMDLEKKVVSEDVPILQTIRFRPGMLTKSDKALGRFFKYLRSYPRAHPSAEFIA